MGSVSTAPRPAIRVCPCVRCSDCGLDSLLAFPSSYSIRIAELLSSNDSPEDSERVFIKGENDQLKSRIAELEARIRSTEDSLKQLVEAKNALQSRLQRQETVLSPIRTLPTDVLCEIFLLCIDAWDGFTYDDPCFQKAPWILVQVSRLWRSVATSFSRLWSYVIVDPDKPNIAEQLVLQLQRSQRHPLFVSFQKASSSKSSGQFSDFLRLLLDSSQRWKVLHLQLPFQLPPQQLEWLLQHELPLPLLRHVSINGFPTTTVSKYPAFRLASNLTKLTGFADSLVQFQWPSSQVRECTIASDGLEGGDLMACELMRQLNEIQIFTYHAEAPDVESPNPPDPPIILPQVTTFTIQFRADWVKDRFLEILLLPTLTCLYLEGSLEHNVRRYALPLHTRSNFRLSSLTLNAADLTSDTCFHLLEAFPTIHELSIHCSKPQLGKILLRLAKEKVVPNLKQLNLCTVDTSEDSRAKLTAARPGLHIAYIYLEYDP